MPQQNHNPATPSPQSPAHQATYQAPSVQDLGKWEVLTLLTTVDVNPASLLDPSGGSSKP